MTLITRPRRFGKTLNMSMLEKFYSIQYANRGELFEGLSIWQEKSPDGEYTYRKIQGTYPVLFISFAGIKESSFAGARENICRTIEEQYNKHDYLLDSGLLNEKERDFYQKISAEMSDSIAAVSLRSLSDFLGRYYGKKVIIFLDKYDTPMQEAYMTEYGVWKEEYELALTNLETKIMFVDMVRGWFDNAASDYNDFIRALLDGDIRAMNIYMNKVSSEIFSSFDTGNKPSGRQPERFYHGFVLGLVVELADRYVITSNQESGLGRYDVMLEPRNTENDAIILEFKVQDEDEKESSDTVQKALRQIEEKDYQSKFTARGIPKQRIRKYGFAFCGKRVLIGSTVKESL